MKFSLVFLAVLSALVSGCETLPEEKPAGAAPNAAAAAPAAPARFRERASLTGSRLAPLDEDDTGPNSVGGVSREDYMNMEASRIKYLNGDGGAVAGAGGPNQGGGRLR